MLRNEREGPAARSLGDMRLTHLGHACLLVEVADQRILIDPGTFSPGFETLTDLDAVLVTHQHADHVDVERLPALLAANPDARLLVEHQSAQVLADAGVHEAQELTAGQVTHVGPVEVTSVGRQHALIHEFVPRVDNVGVVLRAGGEPTLFHPGDAYDTEPGEVDILALPISAPWAAVKETIAFVRRIAPTAMVPIHDALLSPTGRAMYLGHAGRFGPEGMQVRDLAGGEPAQM